jgi:hypothetical protein
MLTRKIINTKTGEVVIVPLTDEEIAELNKYPLEDAVRDIKSEYINAMRVLQADYSQEEVNTFASKQAAISDVRERGLDGASQYSLLLLSNLAGSTTSEAIMAQVVRIEEAILTFNNYLSRIEKARDDAEDALKLAVTDDERRAAVESLRTIYNQLRG